MALSRRVAIGLGVAGAAAAALGWQRTRRRRLDPLWLAYKARFFVPEGRIVDTGNGGVSHSEGQGYGMLFAAAYNDRETFDKLWTWTQKTLRRPDGLHSWRYVPGANPPVADPNNASDGDLLMAWALLRASRQWGGTYAADSRALATAIKAAIVTDGEKAYLLPGLVGFTDDRSRVVNLSYWIFPAIRDLARYTDDAVWSRLYNTGTTLIDTVGFGPRHLPPDWLETFGQPLPAEKFPPRFGYDAVRIPLNLVWGGAGQPERLAVFADTWNAFPDGAPAWINLVVDSVSPEKQSAGMHAIALLTAAAAQGKTLPLSALPTLDTATDYYSASLLMQCRLCLMDLAAAHVA